LLSLGGFAFTMLPGSRDRKLTASCDRKEVNTFFFLKSFIWLFPCMTLRHTTWITSRKILTQGKWQVYTAGLNGLSYLNTIAHKSCWNRCYLFLWLVYSHNVNNKICTVSLVHQISKYNYKIYFLGCLSWVNSKGWFTQKYNFMS